MIRPFGAMLLAVAPALVGIVVGLLSAYWAVAAGPSFDTLAAGPWTAQPDSGTRDADPYEVARRVRRESAVPLGFESLAFTAARDSEEAALDGRCNYRMEGAAPPARFWTLTVTDAGGRVLDTATRRTGMTSVETVRLGPTPVAIALSARPRPGNWIPLKDGAFVLTLRLYDTVVGSGFGVSKLSLPQIVKESCR